MNLDNYFIHKTKKKYFNNYLERLCQHSFQPELDPKKIKDFGRSRQIRRLTRAKPPRMYINKKSIGIPPGYTLVKTKNGFKLQRKK
jgi:hypothetical protein